MNLTFLSPPPTSRREKINLSGVHSLYMVSNICMCVWVRVPSFLEVGSGPSCLSQPYRWRRKAWNAYPYTQYGYQTPYTLNVPLINFTYFLSLEVGSRPSYQGHSWRRKHGTRTHTHIQISDTIYVERTHNKLNFFSLLSRLVPGQPARVTVGGESMERVPIHTYRYQTPLYT